MEELELVDTHAHLADQKFHHDKKEIISRARAGGVRQIITVGYDIPSSYDSVALASEYEFIFFAPGVHPHDAQNVSKDYLDVLYKLACHTRAVALGEMGLDYYRNLSPRKVQLKVFREQLALARELSLPVIIHDREAHDDLLEVLRNDGPGPAGGVMHCFSGTWEMAQECISMGFYISFAGPVTYPNSSRLTEVLRSLPRERLLVETDCPYLSPQPCRGKRNEPFNVRYVVKHIASVLDMPVSELAQVTTENARRLFGLPG